MCCVWRANYEWLATAHPSVYPVLDMICFDPQMSLTSVCTCKPHLRKFNTKRILHTMNPWKPHCSQLGLLLTAMWLHMKLAAIPSIAHASNAGRYFCVLAIDYYYSNDSVTCIPG